ncbi:sulfurtransferase [Cocleimonas flava]|uniref:Thiosulfate/3-mercaptopyruvate sulfurtransferase n=1 Tax=Cocleimonas flava TaxID=634765 RepID=A0A4R1EXD3_9GAMM|nr:sulfurtransferase [Cocleimonas flava]TCJ84654.1 thiosulfate/3-mercaptopyruvate sulfurtransferase [Cocleimonas flava]
MKYTNIVSTQTLEDNLDNPDWIIFDCRTSLIDRSLGLKNYQENHIPNAFHCHLEKDLSSEITPESGRHPLPDFDALIQKLNAWGIGKNTQVIAYDDASNAYSGRLWWQLRAFGFNNVAVLDGGIQQWIKEGRKLTTEIPAAVPKSDADQFNFELDPEAIISTAQVLQNIEDKTFTLIDARTPERYRGESEPLDTVAGRVPGAINRAFQLNLDDNGRFLPAAELKAQFDDLLQNENDQLVNMCGSGVTACHNMLALEIAGITGSKLYVGSWSEWIRDEKRPVGTG